MRRSTPSFSVPTRTWISWALRFLGNPLIHNFRLSTDGTTPMNFFGRISKLSSSLTAFLASAWCQLYKTYYLSKTDLYATFFSYIWA
jgi:hypothetical protein